MVSLLMDIVWQILHGYKNQMGEESWNTFVTQFPQALRDRLASTYGV